MNTRRQVLAYIVVGGINTLFGYSIYAFFLYLGLHFAVAAFLANCLGILFNFQTTGKLVFKNRDNSLLPRFFAVYGFLYVLNIIVIKLSQPFVNNYVGGLIAVVVSAAVGFMLNKYLVFRELPATG